MLAYLGTGFCEWNVAEVTVCDLQVKLQQHCGTLVLSLFLITCSQKPATMSREHTSSPIEAHVVRNWGFLPIGMWGSHFRSKPTNPSQNPDDSSPGPVLPITSWEMQSQITRRSRSQIPDSQKLCVVINVWLSKAARFGDNVFDSNK